jgi:mono/diheme cytochrome c family protein
MDSAAPPTDAGATPGGAWRRRLKRTSLGLVVIGLLIQAVPYGRGHDNPPVTAEPAWDSPATAALVTTACGDCHTNTSVWPWYSNVAPASWLVQNDVDGGRKRLNFSEWNLPQAEADEIIEQIRSGSMPPLQYKIIHRGAALSAAQRDQLIAGLQTTFRASPPIPGRRERD